MQIFVVDAENRVAACAAAKPIHVKNGEYSFVNMKDLAGVSGNWPATRLVEIWNKLPHTKKVLRFTDRKTAIQRIWRAVQDLPPKKKDAPRRSGGLGKSNPFHARDGTKASKVIALLRRPTGATLTELMTETGWQSHSVRGFISGHLSKRLGLRIQSFKPAGERVYRILKGDSK